MLISIFLFVLELTDNLVSFLFVHIIIVSCVKSEFWTTFWFSNCNDGRSL